MSEEIEIRRMQRDDLPAVLAIQSELGFQNWKSGHFEAEIADLKYSLPWVLIIGNIQAYMVLKILGDEAELCSIATHPSSQRCGLARTLLQKGVDVLQLGGVQQIFLEVRRSNLAAQALYRRCSFLDNGVRRQYYPDGEDALLMVRNHVSR